MRIVFFASSKLALPALHQLLTSGYVIGICLPIKEFEGKQHFRDLAQMSNTPIVEVKANELNSKLKKWIQKLKPDYGFVLTFSYKFPEVVLNAVPGGFYNIHFGALPKYRGPEPLFWQMKNQETDVDITIHKMDSDWDTGAIVMTDKVQILPNEMYGGMQIKLSQSVIMTISKFITVLSQNMVVEQPQPSGGNYYKKPQYEDILIDWQTQNSKEIQALILATNPWNKGAITYIRGMMVKIVAVTERTNIAQGDMLPGTLFYEENNASSFVKTIDDKILELDIIYLEEGFVSGAQFKQFGISSGERFVKG
jgi:methionyl-tRNA formyltransferase